MKTKNLLAACAVLASGVCVSAPYPQYQHLVEKHAAAQGLDANLVWAVMARESGGHQYATSHKNARGLLQVIPPTAARMGVNPKYLYNPEHNIIAGTRYLRFLSNRYKGNINLILAGYNAGEGAVDKYGGIPPYRETQKYVRLVKAKYARLSNGTIPSPAASVKVVGRKNLDSPYKKAVLTDKTNITDAPARLTGAKHQMQIAQHKPEPKSWDVFGDF